jgi:hypothetical protein
MIIFIWEIFFRLTLAQTIQITLGYQITSKILHFVQSEARNIQGFWPDTFILEELTYVEQPGSPR